MPGGAVGLVELVAGGVFALCIDLCNVWLVVTWPKFSVRTT